MIKKVKNINKPLVIATLMVCLLFMPWANMPIYPDEIAYRVILARYIPDHGVLYGNWSLCSATGDWIYPLIFIPVAYLASLFDSYIGYAPARLIPLISMIIVIYGALLTSKAHGHLKQGLIILGAFVGIAGSGILFARPEALQVLSIGICYVVLGTLLSKNKNCNTTLLSALVLIFLWVSVYSHLQAVLFAPVSIYALFLIKENNDRSKFIHTFAFFSILIVFYGITWKRINCYQYPAIQEFLDQMIVHASWKDIYELKNFLLEQFVTYLDKFTYRRSYDVQYLPNTYEPSVTLGYFNMLITSIVSVGVLSGVVTFFAIPVAYLYFSIKNSSFTRWFKNREFYCINFSFLVAAPALFLLVFDGQAAFYRAFFINTCFYISLSLLTPFVYIRKMRAIQSICSSYLLITLIATGASCVINIALFSKALADGYTGPSISSNTNWELTSQSLNQLTKDSLIEVSKGSIVVDDATYLAMQKHPRLIPITYLALQSTLLGIPFNDALELAKAKIVLVRCSSLGSLNLRPQKQFGDFCFIQPGL